jgi:co-chaperonin GroES (HSP10)
MNIVPVDNNIIIQFKDKTKDGFFVDDNSSDVGIVLDLGGNHERSGKYSRVAYVRSVGPKASEFKPGDRIAVDHLMWTNSFKFEGETYWMTRTSEVIGFVRD